MSPFRSNVALFWRRVRNKWAAFLRRPSEAQVRFMTELLPLVHELRVQAHSFKGLERILEGQRQIGSHYQDVIYTLNQLHRQLECQALAPPETEWKKRIVDDFSRWLEDFPEPLPDEDSTDLQRVDLLTLLSEFTALKHEVHLQNRQQNRTLSLAEKSLADYGKTMETLTLSKNRMQDLQSALVAEAEKKTVLPFLDVRDSLVRGHEAALAIVASKSFFARLPRGMEGIVEGYEMAIRRFDRALAQVQVRRVETVGQPFDARTMRALSARPDPDMPEGRVLEEYLSGFVRSEEVLRTADVIVSTGPPEEAQVH